MSTEPPETNGDAWLKSTERQVRRAGDAKIARLRRRLDAPLERVWTALTDRDQLRRWFGDVTGDLHEGATLTIDVGADHNVTSRILRCEPRRRVLVTWWYEAFPAEHVDQVELRLTADGDGTLLELEHRSDDQTEWWLGAGSGWEYALIKMSVLLRGGDPAGVSSEEFDEKLGPLWMAAGAG